MTDSHKNLPRQEQEPLNKGLLLIIGGAVIFGVARYFGTFRTLRTPFGVILNERNNGDSLDVKVGSTLSVSLQSSPSVGTWRLSPANDPLFNQPTTTSAIKTGLGYSFRQSRIWKITPEMVGTHRIQLDYQRGDEAPIKTFSVVVTVA